MRSCWECPAFGTRAGQERLAAAFLRSRFLPQMGQRRRREEFRQLDAWRRYPASCVVKTGLRVLPKTFCRVINRRFRA